MNGIREPKRNGGSMANNQGPRRAALVGNPIYPQVNGRTNHVVPAVIGAGLAMPIIGAGIRAAARPFGQFVMRQVPKLIKTGKNKGKPLLDSKGVQQFYKSSKKNPATQGFDTNALGGFFARDPVVSTGGKVVSGLLSPTTGGYIQKGARLVFSPTGIATGLIYSNGKYFNKDGKEVKKPKGDIKLGDNVDIKGGGADTEPKVLTEAEKAKIESDNRIKQMDKYREIMDIKGMSKDAAYKSLIDAGKIIQEGGNLKEQLKSGKLIQNLTQAASKRFDKVGDTEAALRSLVVKGEIDNEMNKEAKALARRKDELTIATLDKNLNTSFADNKAIATKNKILGQAGTDYAAKNTKGIDFRGNLIDAADFADVITTVKENTETGTLDESQIIEEWTNNFVSDKNVPDGDYTVGDAIVTIKDKIVQKVMR
jgi:hypothetical protein